MPNTIALNYLPIILLVSFLYCLRNLIVECLRFLCSSDRYDNVIKFEKHSCHIVLIIFIIAIGYGIIFIIGQAWSLILAGEGVVIIQKISVPTIFMIMIIRGYFNGHQNKGRNLLQIAQMWCYIIFLWYLPFTYNETMARSGDILFVDDFIDNEADRQTVYDEVFRVKDVGLLGNMEQLVYIGREDTIKQSFQFKYTIYNVTNECVRSKIESQWASDIDAAKKVSLENVEIYEFECNRFQDYEVGIEYPLIDKVKYDRLIVVKTRKQIVSFFYSDMNEISEEEILDRIAAKFCL